MGRQEQDNHADRMNPNNDAYWQSRGYDERPEEWPEQVDDKDQPSQETVEDQRQQA